MTRAGRFDGGGIVGLLDQLMGGGQQRQQYDDFVGRYDRGAPYDGISDDEAASRYREVSREISPRDYEASAEEAFSRMAPQERTQFARMLQERTRGFDDFQDFNRDGIDDRYQDPRTLAQVTSRVHQQQPGVLEQLLGGATGGGMNRGMGGGMGGGSAMENPLARAAMAGIAAMAVKKMMGGR